MIGARSWFGLRQENGWFSDSHEVKGVAVNGEDAGMEQAECEAG